MEPAEWEKLQVLFEAALALPAEQRDAYLQQHNTSEALLQEVHSLLKADKSCESLWQNPHTKQTTSGFWL